MIVMSTHWVTSVLQTAILRQSR